MKKEAFEAYSQRQRDFWNTDDEREAKFARVDTESEGNEAKYRALADSTGELLIQDLQLPQAPVLMELGCGVGRMIQQMQKRLQFATLYGLDISETMISYTQKNMGGDSRVKLQVNTGYDLSSVPDGAIDFAYSVDVFIHIFDAAIIENYLREVFRTLKRDGYFRFDVRFLNPERMFSNSLGGRWAKFLYNGTSSAQTLIAGSQESQPNSMVTNIKTRTCARKSGAWDSR